MANTNYKKSYSILGVFQDDDWDTVRTAYKRQIRRWHPDRFQDTDQRRIAEDKSKDINLAYQMLDDYFREFGSLPPDDSAQRETPPATSDEWPAHEHDTGPKHDEFYGSEHGQTTFSTSQQPRHRGYTRIIVAAAVIAIGYMMLEPLFPDIQNVPETTLAEYPLAGPAAGDFAANQTDSSAPPGASAPAKPTDVPAGWQVNEKITGHGPKLSPTSVRATIISIGVSKQDVLAIQGHPLRQTDTEWDYGLSRIHFEDGKVTGWYENPMNPLIVQR